MNGSVPAVPVDADHFRERLAQLEHQHRLTQEKAAQKIGVSGRHYVRWKKGEATPGYDSIEKVAVAYGLDPDEFMLDVSENGGVNRRLEALEALAAETSGDVKRLLELWGTELLPALETLREVRRRAQATEPKSRRSAAKDRPA